MEYRLHKIFSATTYWKLKWHILSGLYFVHYVFFSSESRRTVKWMSANRRKSESMKFNEMQDLYRAKC